MRHALITLAAAAGTSEGKKAADATADSFERQADALEKDIDRKYGVVLSLRERGTMRSMVEREALSSTPWRRASLSDPAPPGHLSQEGEENRALM